MTSKTDLSQPVIIPKIPEGERRVRTYFDGDASGWWQINDRWFIVRNDQNPSYAGSVWARYFYDLVYIPKISEGNKGHRQEVLNAEFKKKVAYCIIGGGSLAVLFFSVLCVPVSNIANALSPLELFRFLSKSIENITG